MLGHATYEDVLVLERRHGSDVFGLGQCALALSRVFGGRWVAKSKNARSPAIEVRASLSPKILRPPHLLPPRTADAPVAPRQ